VIERGKPVLCMVTALNRMSPSAESADFASDRLVERVHAAARAGVSLIQVREPALDGGGLHTLVVRCRRAVDGTGCRVVVNDRSDVALGAGADGVHLREDSIAPAVVRRLVVEPLLVGRSVHSAEDAARVAATGSVDYLIFGTVFPTRSKRVGQPVSGVAALRDAVRAAAPVPVLAIGGVTKQNAGEVADAGAAGVAAISLFADEVAEASQLAETVTYVGAAFRLR
jgi:thiamine-phosphate diphosphorylase